MSSISRCLKLTATSVFFVYGTSAYADRVNNFGWSISSAPYTADVCGEACDDIPVSTASLEVESQQAIDLLTGQLAHVQPSEYQLGKVNSLGGMDVDYGASSPAIQLATLEAESLRAVEEMKRLLQQGELSSYEPNSDLDVILYDR